MNAYQLKVTIKGSHPPIWRRVIVPAGLTFSQLTLVINTAMGWSGYHLSDYTFNRLGIRFCDDFDPDESSMYDEYDSVDAAEYKIDYYFDRSDRFIYTYDFGDYWEHTVDIQKKIKDYEYNYPMITKYKGDLPYEDCGGIDRWYDMQEILKDPGDPEYEDIKEWIDEQGDNTFDLEWVNKELEGFALTDEESEPKTRAELYEDYFDGKPFCRIKTPRHGARSQKKTFTQGSDILIQQIQSLLKEQQGLEEDAIIEAYRASGKTFDEVMSFLNKK